MTWILFVVSLCVLLPGSFTVQCQFSKSDDSPKTMIYSPRPLAPPTRVYCLPDMTHFIFPGKKVHVSFRVMLCKRLSCFYELLFLQLEWHILFIFSPVIHSIKISKESGEICFPLYYCLISRRNAAFTEKKIYYFKRKYNHVSTCYLKETEEPVGCLKQKTESIIKTSKS